MTELQKRKIIQTILGFFLGRVSFFGINPIGIAFFASGYVETGIRIPLGISILLGMFTVFPLEIVLCHMMVMAAMVFMIDLLERKQVHMQLMQTMILLLFTSGVMTLVRVSFFSYGSTQKFAVIVECVLSVAATRVLYDGQHFLIEHRQGQYPGNEELLSLVLLGIFVAMGLPAQQVVGITPVRLMVYFVILAMGYCYGTGAGAMAGAVGGVCLLTMDDCTVMVGVMASLGMLAGVLRNQRKLVLCTGYFWGILLCSFFVPSGEFPYTDFGNAGLAALSFFFVPERVFGKTKLHCARWEDYWESEKLQEILRYKLADFSASFYKLSEILAKEELFESKGQTEEISESLAAASERVCGTCEYAQDCEAQFAFLQSEYVSEISSEISVSEEGGFAFSHFPKNFVDCIHKEHFLWEVNQKIHFSNTMNIFRNQLFYQKQMIAEQMKEVGEILGDLSEQMPRVRKVPLESREEMERELKHLRVRVGEMAFYEKYDGRLEIHLMGRTSRGRCVTTKEVEKTLSTVLHKPVRALEQCRKVFPMEMEEFIFLEVAALKAEVGISRLSGNQDDISGDTFSCMQLSESEFFLALSDGMGSGEDAYTESEKVIELLEQMTEVGFSERAAVKLINSFSISSEKNNSFATADITLLNLYQKAARFIKCGASTTYLYHNKEFFAIEGEALPIGIMSGMEPYMVKYGIGAGDYVVMMTDGISDSDVELRSVLWRYMEKRCGAQELADGLMEEAVHSLGGKPRDDMSVLVVKLYED